MHPLLRYGRVDIKFHWVSMAERTRRPSQFYEVRFAPHLPLNVHTQGYETFLRSASYILSDSDGQIVRRKSFGSKPLCLLKPVTLLVLFFDSVDQVDNIGAHSLNDISELGLEQVKATS